MPKSKHQKQIEADARQRAVESMTPEARLAEIAGRPGNSEKEKARLTKLVDQGASRSK